MPRTVTLEPSPLEVRSIDTPLMRCSDSARLVSGNLPMSSATMPSTTPWLSRLRFIDEVRLPRMPVTCTVSSVVGSTSSAAARWRSGGSCAQAGPARAASSADVSIALRGTALYVFMMIPPQGIRSWRFCVVSARVPVRTARIGAMVDSVVNKRHPQCASLDARHASRIAAASAPCGAETLQRGRCRLISPGRRHRDGRR